MMSALARFEQFLNRRFSHSSTPIHYISDLRIFIRSHDDEPPESITAADIDLFVDAQLNAGLSIPTVNRRLASLHTFFEFLASEKSGLLNDDQDVAFERAQRLASPEYGSRWVEARKTLEEAGFRVFRL